MNNQCFPDQVTSSAEHNHELVCSFEFVTTEQRTRSEIPTLFSHQEARDRRHVCVQDTQDMTHCMSPTLLYIQIIKCSSRLYVQQDFTAQ